MSHDPGATLSISHGQRALWTLAIPLLAGAGLLFYGTSEFGLGVSHDSVVYLDTAQTLATQGTLARPSPDGQLTPLTHYPPLYPSILAAFGSSVRQIHQNVRPLNIALFAGTILLLGVLTYRCTRGSVALALTSAGLAALSLDLLVVYSRVWSEPPFLFLTLCGLLLLSRYTQDPDWRRLCVAALPFSLAWLTRYIGVVFVPTGVLAIWLLVKRDRRTRIVHSVLYCVVVSTPIAVALLQNRIRTGNATNRSLSVHEIAADELSDGLKTMSSWLIPASSPAFLQIMAAAVVGSVVAHSAYTAWRCLTRSKVCNLEPNCSSVLWLFLGSYLAGLLLARIFVDGAIPLDPRTLSPALLALLVLVPSHLREAARGAGARSLIVVSIVALMSFYALRATRWAAAAHVHGLHYNTREWHQTRALEIAKEIPTCVTLYANNPELVYWITGRRAWFVDTGPNTKLAGHLATLQRATNQRVTPLMLVLIHEFEEEPFVERPPEVMSQLTRVWQDERASAYAAPPVMSCP